MILSEFFIIGKVIQTASLSKCSLCRTFSGRSVLKLGNLLLIIQVHDATSERIWKWRVEVFWGTHAHQLCNDLEFFRNSKGNHPSKEYTNNKYIMNLRKWGKCYDIGMSSWLVVFPQDILWPCKQLISSCMLLCCDLHLMVRVCPELIFAESLHCFFFRFWTTFNCCGHKMLDRAGWSLATGC